MYAIYNHNTKDQFVVIVCSRESGRRRSSKNNTTIVVLALLSSWEDTSDQNDYSEWLLI